MTASIRERIGSFIAHLLLVEEKRQAIRQAHEWHREKLCEKHKSAMLWDRQASHYICITCETEKMQPPPITPRVVDFSSLETYDRSTPPQHPALRPTRLASIPSTPQERQTDSFLIEDIASMETREMPAIRIPNTGEYEWLI